MSTIFDLNRQRAPEMFEGTDKEATAIIEVAEKEFQPYAGKVVLVKVAEVHDEYGNYGDRNFDPPLPLRVQELEIVSEDWAPEGLLPCWHMVPPEGSKEDFYVFGSLIKADGSREGKAGWQELG